MSRSSDYDATCFDESRCRLPVRLLALGGVMILIGLAHGVVSFRNGSAEQFPALAVIVSLAGAATCRWAIYRVFRPALITCIGFSHLSLRCREFEKGWADAWMWRRFAVEEICRVEIGRRTDYPRSRSYSDTAAYEFVVVVVRSANGDLLRYSYAPLQRLARRESFIAALCSHPLLRDKVTRVSP